AALTRFEHQRLQSELQKLGIDGTGVDAQYVYAARFAQPPQHDERQQLLALLDLAHEQPPAAGLVVTPRLGTISPWSSKAEDIAHNSGITNLRRLERGIVYQFVA